MLHHQLPDNDEDDDLSYTGALDLAFLLTGCLAFPLRDGEVDFSLLGGGLESRASLAAEEDDDLDSLLLFLLAALLSSRILSRSMPSLF